ncbi:MAG: 50S ribosomal protein L25 [Armatimonadetes bacterium]|nr:50S ribosomal protein L25 [Armatimonadota bacterium]
MNEILLQAQRRQPGRSAARAMRRKSVVPGIFYFHGEEPIPVAAHELALRPLIRTSESHLVRMRLDDGVEKTCILKDISFDPITDRPVHFDLQGVSADEAIAVEVPVNLVGQAIGQRDGGIVEALLHKIEIECLPQDLPDHINVDISNLGIGESIHVSDLTLEKGQILTHGDVAVVAIAAPRTESDAASGSTEPEVIAKGKEKA